MTEVNKVDAEKLKTVLVDLAKLSNLVKMMLSNRLSMIN